MTTQKRRGFAAMDPERQREIAKLGGQAAHARGKAHEFTREEARHAGKKGGWVVSRDHHYMSQIGMKGGKTAQRKKQQEQYQAEKKVATE